jgi:hypothetical protein
MENCAPVGGMASSRAPQHDTYIAPQETNASSSSRLKKELTHCCGETIKCFLRFVQAHVEKFNVATVLFCHEIIHHGQFWFVKDTG